MVISIPAPTAVAFLVLLIIIGILFSATVQARRKSAHLLVSLDNARLKQESDERELNQRSAMDSLKNEFVSTVSHELRTPLTSIKGALGLLSSGVFGNLDAKSQNLLRIALSNTERLIRLINDLLDLERMDSGAAKLQVKRCSLAELVYQALETMGSLADSGQVRLIIAPPAKAIITNVFFDADPDRILQVLTNLLSNAIKFAPPASTVTFEAETPPDELIFRVVDQGRGIPEDQLETVFEKFTQVDHPDARAIGGTGLGLAICRSIIQQHGGSIWAQRNMVKGASICVRLPRQQRTYDNSGQGATASTETRGGARSGQRMAVTSNQAVLICDSNEARRGMKAMQMRSQGITVLEAGAPAEATETAKGHLAVGPLLGILLDLHMPEKTGWETLKLLKEDPVLAELPLICLSLGDQAESMRLSEQGLPVLPTEDQLFSTLSQALQSERGPGRILLVEDDLDLANVVLSGFNQTNMLVEHAATFYRAKALVRERRPDLIILDLTLPEGSGFAVVQWLRSFQELRSIPLIVYSGREIAEEDDSTLQVGPTRFLTKARVSSRDLEQLVIAILPQNRPASDGTSAFGRKGQPASIAPVA